MLRVPPGRQTLCLQTAIPGGKAEPARCALLSSRRARSMERVNACAFIRTLGEADFNLILGVRGVFNLPLCIFQVVHGPGRAGLLILPVRFWLGGAMPG